MKVYLILVLMSLSSPLLAKEKAPGSHGKPPEFSLQWNSTQPHKHWLFSNGAHYDGPARLAPLAAVKKYELDEKYEECTEQILKIWSTYRDFRGWMALQGTQCLVYQIKFSSPQNAKLYKRWWNHLLKQEEGLLFGPWTNELVRGWSELAQGILKTTKLPLGLRAEVAESWRLLTSSLNRSDRQDLYKIIVEQLKGEQSFGWAEAVAVREGLVKSSESLQLSYGTSGDSLAKTPEMISSRSKDEDQLQQRFQDAINANKLDEASSVAVSYLKKYPNGTKAGAIQDKLMQVYFAAVESTPLAATEKRVVLDRCLTEIGKLHSSRLIEWAKNAHRRGDFKGALAWSQKSLADEESSPDGAALLFIAGRSAYFLGDYRNAIEHFDRLLQRHSGYSDYWEVKFRRAFAFIRLKENAKAEEALTELWLAPENKTYALASLYWLIRLKQKRQAPVEDLVKVMQDRYSLTYYGLKLNAESNQQKIVMSDESQVVSVKQSWVLTPAEKKQWTRVNDLATAGWYTAAQGELSNLVLNGGPEQKFLWAQQLIQVFAYPQALRSFNELIDLEERWRKAAYLRTVFPKPLEDVVRFEAQKNDLHPLLVYSLIRQESAFLIGATSRSQAKGLMQLIPPTANEVAQDLKIKNFNSDQMYHPMVNLKFGTHYLAKVIRQFGGNVSVGLAAYNAGPHRLKKFFEGRGEVENPALLSQEDPWSDLWIEELPWLETNLYVKSILRNRVVYQLLEQGSFEWPVPVWKDLFLGGKKVSRSLKEGTRKMLKR